MKWLIYDILFLCAYLVLLPKFLLRMSKRGGYADRFADRFGRFPQSVKDQLQDGTRRIWIHAVSVGEVYVAGQFMREFRKQNPNAAFVLSTTSSTGWREAEKMVEARDVRIYCPLDFRPCVRKTLDLVNPQALILTESEIWPNLIRTARARGIPLFLINSRISDRSAPRYKKLRVWFGDVFNLFTQIMAQSDLDKQRLVDAGTDPARIEVTGSAKFDVANRNPAKESELATWLEQRCGVTSNNIRLLGGSTWPGEDAVLIDIYKRLKQDYPQLRLILAPRHFEKADAVEANITATGLPRIRKSKDTGAKDDNAIVLADTTGELMGFYGNADIVFVGKSLCEHGAQNMIEPCLCGTATVIGPNTENFRPVMSDLLAARAIIQVDDAQELEAAIAELLASPSLRTAQGERATQIVEARKGVVPRCVTVMLQAIESCKTC